MGAVEIRAVECELLSTCVFLTDRLANQSAIAEIFKRAYCDTNKSQCARYMVFAKLGIDKVPRDLFPSAVDRAKSIVAAA